MNNGEYWQKRFELLEQAAHQQGVQCYADIEKQYRQAQKQLEGQIAAWYQRFASNNGVTLAEAKRMLNAKELAELKWDVNQYIQYGQENAINGTWVKQLENASARFHISRLEALKLQTQQSIEVMFGNQLDSIDSTMRNVYKSGYYHTAYEIQWVLVGTFPHWMTSRSARSLISLGRLTARISVKGYGVTVRSWSMN